MATQTRIWCDKTHDGSREKPHRCFSTSGSTSVSVNSRTDTDFLHMTEEYKGESFCCTRNDSTLTHNNLHLNTIPASLGNMKYLGPILGLATASNAIDIRFWHQDPVCKVGTYTACVNAKPNVCTKLLVITGRFPFATL